jgi:tRNA(Ile)-lysidine synthase
MVLNALERILPLFDPPIIVGISGGADSMVLLHALQADNHALIAAHFNHKLREEADQEAAQVKEYCLSINLPFREGEGDVRNFAEETGKSIEEAARILRYKFLFQVAEKEMAGAVAVAHHADDQVETILMNLLRGSGTTGLSGMQLISLPNAWSDTIALVRPLLEIDKNQILEYHSKHNLPVVEDPSNKDLNLHRNNIRHTLLPQLEKLTPGFKKRLLQTAEIIKAEDQALSHYTESIWEECINSQGASYLQLVRETLLNSSAGVQRRIVRRALATLRPDYRELSFRQVETALDFFRNPANKSSNWVAKVNLSQSPKWVVFSTWETDLVKDQFPQLLNEKQTLEVKPGEFDLGNGWYFLVSSVEYSPDEFSQITFPGEDFRVWVDKKALQDNATLRVRTEGDEISPLGMEGKKMKVSDLMINEKIPALYRENWPLLAAGELILWVPGGRLSTQASVTEETKEIWELAFIRRQVS